MGVTERQLTQKIGAPQERWTPYDIAQLGVIYRSILRGEMNKEDEFPSAGGGGVTAAEILSTQQATGPQQPERPQGQRQAPADAGAAEERPPAQSHHRAGQQDREGVARLGYEDHDAEEMLVFTATHGRRPGSSIRSPDLTQEQAKAVLDALAPLQGPRRRHCLPQASGARHPG